MSPQFLLSLALVVVAYIAWFGFIRPSLTG
jgi:hypothetical protein